MTFLLKDFKVPNGVSIISFNVFNTLLSRPFEKPSHIFKFIQEYVNKNLEKKIDFEKTRIRAEKDARKKAFPREEITLDEIYDNFYELPLKVRGAIKFLEIETEFKFSFPRATGKMLYDFLKEQNFQLIAITDTYFDLAFIKKLLEKNGFVFDAIFCSSSVLKQKKTGNLYIDVIKKLGISSQRILHIGDDVISDIEKAKSYGLHTFHLPNLVEIFYSNAYYKKLFKGQKQDLLTSSLISAICENIDISPNSFSKTNLFDNNLYNLGFIGFGSTMFAFVNWIYNIAQKCNVSSLFFIARDGYIIEKMFKIMFPDAKLNIEYLEVSEHSLMPLMMKTKSDVVDIYSKKYKNTTVKNFILTQLKQDPNKIIPYLQNIGYQSINQNIKSVFHTRQEKIKIRKIIEFYSTDILQKAESSINNILDYLDKMQIRNEQIAICDVGYSGTIQSIIEKIVNDNILGLYLLTNINAKKLKYSYGFLDNNLEMKKFNKLKTFICIIETVIFSAPSGSVLKYNNSGQPIYQKLHSLEAARLNANSYTWKGMIDFTLLLKKRFGKDLNLITYQTKNLNKLFLSFIRNPSFQDAKLLQNIFFKDMFDFEKYKNITSFDNWKSANIKLKNNKMNVFFNFLKNKK